MNKLNETSFHTSSPAEWNVPPPTSRHNTQSIVGQHLLFFCWRRKVNICWALRCFNIGINEYEDVHTGVLALQLRGVCLYKMICLGHTIVTSTTICQREKLQQNPTYSALPAGCLNNLTRTSASPNLAFTAFLYVHLGEKSRLSPTVLCFPRVPLHQKHMKKKMWKHMKFSVMPLCFQHCRV